ncbi:MAG: M17 family peptidase N-terminal domain-containing protein, partial [Desulfobulbaceae bacterium]|nr:M17 family peptidase N-terminal domain-containing protein [Desulfobulbaceae bacterium]
MKITVKKYTKSTKTDLLIYCLPQITDPKTTIFPGPQFLADSVQRAHSAGDFTAREGQTLLCYPPLDATTKHLATRLLAVGLGKEELNRESFRKCGGTIASVAQKTKAARITVIVPEELDFPLQEMTQSLVEGVILGSYTFTRYKTVGEDDDPPHLIAESVFSATKLKEAAIAAERGRQGAI